MSGRPLELVEQNGAKILRVVGEDTSTPTAATADGAKKVTTADASSAAERGTGGPVTNRVSTAGEPAKLDASMARARAAERATAERVAANPEFRGRTFLAPPPPDPGYDWLDDLGRTFDAMGDGSKAKYFKLEQFKASIDHHLLKGNTFTVIDMTGYTTEQIAAVRAYLDEISSANVIRVGF